MTTTLQRTSKSAGAIALAIVLVGCSNSDQATKEAHSPPAKPTPSVPSLCDSLAPKTLATVLGQPATKSDGPPPMQPGAVACYFTTKFPDASLTIEVISNAGSPPTPSPSAAQKCGPLKMPSGWQYARVCHRVGSSLSAWAPTKGRKIRVIYFSGEKRSDLQPERAARVVRSVAIEVDRAMTQLAMR